MTKRYAAFTLCCIAICATFGITSIFAQTPTMANPAPQSGADAGITARFVLGEITELASTENRLTLRTDAGNTVVVALTATTAFKRVPPGEKTLTNAAPIAIADLGVGDRVIARGSVDTAARAAAAREVIVMTRADLTARRERERAEWNRGIVGVVTAVNPATKEITVQPRARGFMGGQVPPVVIEATAGDILFRRYAPDSVRFQDAKLSSFTDLKVGDQMRARGERSPDNARFLPKEVVSGAFRTIAGTVTAVAPDGSSATVTPMNGGTPVTVSVKSDSTLRRLPEGGVMGAMGGRPGAAGGMARQGGEAAGGGAPPVRRDANAQGGQRPQGAGMMGGGGGGGGFGAGRGVDFSEMLERLPQITLAELKPGDMVIVSSTAGNDPSRLTAIALVAGVERILNAMQSSPQGAARPGANSSLGTGLPGGFDLGIGGP